MPLRVRHRVVIPLSRVLHQWPGVRRLGHAVVYLVGPPTLHQIFLRSRVVTTSAEQAACTILGKGAVQYAQEYEQVQERIAHRKDHLRYPEDYAIEEATAYFLYMLVRNMRPSRTLEVGVADGRSTEIILSALDANDHGRLISIDVSDEVGDAAKGHPRWHLHVRSSGPSSSDELNDLLADTGPPDLFFHDADHTYPGQYVDYITALDHMLPGSLFVSDDVDQSWAFLDVTANFGVKPVVLVDHRKAVGAFLLPEERPEYLTLPAAALVCAWGRR